MARRNNDWYPTPDWATEELLKRVPIAGDILEPCIGDGAMARVLDRRGVVYGNDIDRSRTASFYGDATQRDLWQMIKDAMGRIDWVVTNPPFNVAAQIIPLAYEYAFEGIAMMLRLSYLEPTEDRGAWLNEHPPTSMIVLPRISFTGDGNTDSVTCAWMVWDKSAAGTISVAENLKFVTPAAQQSEGLFSNGLAI